MDKEDNKEFTKTWVKRLVQKSGRRKSDSIPAIVQLIRETAFLLFIVYAMYKGIDIAPYIGLIQ